MLIVLLILLILLIYFFNEPFADDISVTSKLTWHYSDKFYYRIEVCYGSKCYQRGLRLKMYDNRKNSLLI